VYTLACTPATRATGNQRCRPKTGSEKLKTAFNCLEHRRQPQTSNKSVSNFWLL